MNLTYDVEGLLLPVTGTLQDLLNETAKQHGKLEPDTKALTFNFRDSSYSAESGGWHPVEIRLTQHRGLWRFAYITDFSYAGFPYPELEKEVDFDFEAGEVSFMHMPSVPISNMEVMDFYQVWEMNFLSYVRMGAFDDITVSSGV